MSRCGVRATQIFASKAVRSSMWVGSVAALISLIGLVSSASAAFSQFEQVDTFAETGEAVQLGGVDGLAVNATGAGGVPAGTLYAVVQRPSGEVFVARYGPTGLFSERWRVAFQENPYERCGPDSPGEVVCMPLANAGPGGVDVEVSQATGNVYVYDGNSTPGSLALVEYIADGSKVVARFGELANPGETTTVSADKIHSSPYPGAIAVNDSGEVYVFDINATDDFYHRLMRFKPQTPGDFEHYAYVEGGDVGAGFSGDGNPPAQPVLDAAGDIYVGAAGEGVIEKYDSPQPGEPLCKFSLKEGGITSLTVNPETGGVFYYAYKKKQVFQLAPCNGENKFIPVGVAINVNPKRDELYAMAYDPKQAFGESRPAGVLYGGAPSAVPSTGFGKGEPGKTSLGYVFAPLEVKEFPPAVEAESVSGVTGTTAQLSAEIDAKNMKASYVFEYLSEAAFQEAGESFAEAGEAPEGGAALEEGEGAVAAGVTLSGLRPGTKYRYRVLVISNCSQGDPEKVCTIAGAGGTFTTYTPASGALPDERAWELVSPEQKSGGQVLPAEPITSSCGLVECKPGAAYQHFPMLSRADGNAVVYEGLSFGPGSATIENEYMAIRTSSGWANANLTPELLQSKAGGLGYRAFQAGLGEGLLGQVGPTLSPEAPPNFANLYLQPTAAPGALTPLLTNANATIHRLSGSNSESLRLTFVGASTDLSRIFFEANDALVADAPEVKASETNLYEWDTGELHLVNLAPGDTEALANASFGSSVFKGRSAISEDGSLAFFSSKTGQAYVRVGGTETIEIDDPGKFLSASSNGSAVLLDDGCLYDLAEEECEDLTENEAEVHQGGFLGLAGQSEDLSHIYFVDSAVLSSGENSEGSKAQNGKPNLYGWVDGELSFVGTLSGKEDAVGWQPSPASRMAEASLAGRYLAFLSQAPLTGFDNIGPCEIEGSGKALDVPCREVFLYDSATGELICPSCNQANAKPLGGSVLRLVKGVGDSQLQSRYLTDSGLLFFDSQDSLAAGDSNGNAEDVYQYKPDEVGDCEREGGCVDLISAGREEADSNFVMMDASGDNAFFTTRDRLVAADKDDLIDLYDARVDGGFPGPPPPKICRGEACQPSMPAPIEPAPQNTSSGANATPAKKCGNGKVKKNGRCVKKPKKHKKKGNKDKRVQHNRGGSK